MLRPHALRVAAGVDGEDVWNMGGAGSSRPKRSFSSQKWRGRIINPFVSGDARWTDIYLPPSFSPTTRYPVLYLLHGFWGSPSSFVDSLRFASISDGLIMDLRARPFIAVMPPGGPTTRRTAGEWAGVWESYVTRRRELPLFGDGCS